MSICICGVCIPYSAIWPFALLAIKAVWDYLGPMLGFKTNKKDDKLCCKSDTNKDKQQIQADDEIIQKLTSSKIAIKLSSEEQWNAALSSDKKIFARFTATWCKPCHAIEPVYKKIAEADKEGNIYFDVDVDEFDDLAGKHGAMSIPYFVCFKDGKSVNNLSGSDEKKIDNFFSQCASL